METLKYKEDKSYKGDGQRFKIRWDNQEINITIASDSDFTLKETIATFLQLTEFELVPMGDEFD